RPPNSLVIDWMLPAPAQGAIIAVCRNEDNNVLEVCNRFNDVDTALCTKIERDFLRRLLGGCSTPISALAVIENGYVHFRGSILSPDGRNKVEIEKTVNIHAADDIGKLAGRELLINGGQQIADSMKHAG